MPLSTKTSTFHALIIEIDIKNTCPWSPPCGFQNFTEVLDFSPERIQADGYCYAGSALNFWVTAYRRMISSCWWWHPKKIASSVNECEKFLLPSWAANWVQIWMDQKILPGNQVFRTVPSSFCFPSEKRECSWWRETKDWGWELLAVFIESYLEQESYSLTALTIAI